MNIERLKNFLENKPTTIELKITAEDCLYFLDARDVLINDSIQTNQENFEYIALIMFLGQLNMKLVFQKRKW